MTDLSYLLPVLVLFVFSLVFAGGIILASSLLGPRNPERKKLTTYECGMPLLDFARKKLSIKYFVIAAIFIVFDLEVAFLYPWALMFRRFDSIGFSMIFALGEMVIFLGILFLGWLYLWKKGALDWD